MLRFPRWCFCMYCKRLKLSTLTLRQAEYCPDKELHRAPVQAPHVAGAVRGGLPRGHLDDFPFDKWVHHSH